MIDKLHNYDKILIDNKLDNTIDVYKQKWRKVVMKKMILDVDTGVDDALAISYALASPEVELIGIVGTYGNVLAGEAAQNSLDILELLGSEEVPVYKGEGCPIGTDSFEVFEISKVIHGRDGIGELYLNHTERKWEVENGVDFLIRSALFYQEELVIVATGPMTDLARAIEKEPQMKNFRGKIVIMGGAVTVPGNCGPFAEANISQDAAAAAQLFDSGLDITMVGLDVTLRTLLTKKETACWRAMGTKASLAYAKLVDYYIGSYEKTSPHLGGCALHDPLAVAVAIEPDLVRTLSIFIQVSQDIEKEEEYGRTIGDPARLAEMNPNVKVAIEVDAGRFMRMFMDRLSRLFRECERR